jgi:endonuclease III
MVPTIPKFMAAKHRTRQIVPTQIAQVGSRKSGRTNSSRKTSDGTQGRRGVRKLPHVQQEQACRCSAGRRQRQRHKRPIGRRPRPQQPRCRNDYGRDRGSVPAICGRQSHAARGELQYINPLTLLVAVVLSARPLTRGEQTTPALLQRPMRMVALGRACPGHDQDHWSLRRQAKKRTALSRKLMEEHGGQVRAAVRLRRCPGRTQNLQTSFSVAFGNRRSPVDTHALSGRNRTGLAVGKTPFE